MTWPQSRFLTLKQDSNLFQQIPLTFGLIGFMVSIYFVLAWKSKSVLRIDYEIISAIGQNNDLVFDQRAYYLLLSSIFVHANLVHLGFNLIWLLAFGHKVEELLNRSQYLFSFLATGISGNILSLLWGRTFVSVGASGAIFGLFGIIVMNQRLQHPKRWRKSLYFALFFFILTISINTNILSHLGGFFSGFLLGKKIGKSKH
ncbi:MAG: rhomboid family intramembrane serine protease [Candidatus Heimdallarchaeota archaeon]